MARIVVRGRACKIRRPRSSVYCHVRRAAKKRVVARRKRKARKA